MKIHMLFYLMLVSLVLLPDIGFFRIDDIILIFIFISVILKIILNKKGIKSYIHYIKWVILILIVYTLSLLNYSNSFQISPDYSNLIKETIRIIKSIIIIIVSIDFMKNRKIENVDKLYNLFLYLSIFTVIIAIMQYFHLFGVNEFLSKYYKGNIQYANLSIYKIQHGMFRANSTFYNSNKYSLFLAISYCILIFEYLLDYSKKKLLFIIVVLIGILLTQSRTTLIIVSIVTLYSFLNIMRVKHKPLKFYIKIFSIVILLILLINLFLSVFKFARFSNISFVQIRYVRYNSYTIFKDILYYYPLFGKSIMHLKDFDFAFDSEYLIILYYSGILGLLLYLCILLNLIFNAINKASWIKKNILLNLLVLLIIAGITSSIIYSNRILPLFIIVYIFINYRNYKIRDKYDNI